MRSARALNRIPRSEFRDGLCAAMNAMVRMPEFHERGAMLSWVVAGLSIASTCTVTFLILRNGIPADFSLMQTVLFVAIWWLTTIWVIAFARRKACVGIMMQVDRSVKIVTQFPLKKHERTISYSSLGMAEVITAMDTDGDTYFTACFFVDGMERIVLVQGADKAACQKAVDEFNAALKS
jgi:hypothetical protein